MDKRLFEAALSGNTKALLELLQGDQNILAAVTLTSAETPLHIAALYGHLDFTRTILQLWPAFAQELNQDGFSPMHLASANGHLDIVTLLLESGQSPSILRELCMQKSMNGRTPLHCACIKGRVNVLRVLLNACPESVQELKDQGETVLHLAVKNNQREAFLLLVQEPSITELVNLMDQEGNSVLHLAIAHKQYQTVRFLLSVPNIDANAANSKGFTSLDVLLMVPSLSDDIGIGEMLRVAGGEKSHHILQLSETQGQTPRNINQSTLSNGSDSNVTKPEDWLKEMWNGIMLMATLIATVTFQAAMTPPGGFWQDWGGNETSVPNKNAAASPPTTTHRPGGVIAYDLARMDFNVFMTLDIICFMTSLLIILLLISPVLLNRYSRYLFVIIRFDIYAAVFFAQLVFLQAIIITTDKNDFGPIVVSFVIVFWIAGGGLVLYDVLLLCFGILKKLRKLIKTNQQR